MNQVLVSRWMLGVSLGVHILVLSGTSESQARPVVPPPPRVVELLVAEPIVAEPIVPEPEPPKPASPEVPVPALPVKLSAEALPEPDVSEPPAELAAEPAPAFEAQAELTGTTLVSETGEGWAAEPGSGGERRGAFRAGTSFGKRARPTGSAPSRSGAAPSLVLSVVPLAELSRRPVPPALGGALKRHYPPDARRQGRSGEAKVRARVEASGKIREALVTYESAPEFGVACRNTLLKSEWSAPLNKKGSPVATWVSYRCKFRIDE